MLIVTEDALILCAHETGRVSNQPSQDWVTVNRRRVLVQADPEGRLIAGCNNTNVPAGMKPCTETLRVREGYSQFVRVAGRPVSLSSLRGHTNGTPPAMVDYHVAAAGQSLVKVSE